MNFNGYTRYCFGGGDQRDKTVDGIRYNVCIQGWVGQSDDYEVSASVKDAGGEEVELTYPHYVRTDAELAQAEKWLSNKLKTMQSN